MTGASWFLLHPIGCLDWIRNFVGDRLCGEDDLSLYHTIVSQIRSAQDEGIKDTKWASWKDCYLKHWNFAPETKAVAFHIPTIHVQGRSYLSFRGWAKFSSETPCHNFLDVDLYKKNTLDHLLTFVKFLRGKC